MRFVSDLGLKISAGFRKTAPDPFVLAILLTVLTAILALLFGTFPNSGEDVSAIRALFDAWRSEKGLWAFLSFGMQMCLVLITGHAVAMTKPIRALIDLLASKPKSTASAAALVAGMACIAGVINWGLGLIVGAFMAREVGRSLHRRGIRAHYPLLCASGFMGLLVWHGGLSGSAPLSMTTRSGAEKVLRADVIEHVAPSGVPLDQTVLAPMNFFVTIGLIIIVPCVLMMLAPKRDEDLCTIEQFHTAGEETLETPGTSTTRSLPDWLDTSPMVTLLLAIPLFTLVVVYCVQTGASKIGLNEINAAMFAIGLALHGSPRRYMAAATDGAKGCAGIIIQFPLYGGIMGMMSDSGLTTTIADGFAALGNETTVPFLSFLSAGVVNLFVPSGGGQWAIQGPVALDAGLAEGVSAGKMIMSVAYGDQLTNMLQPFWALPLLGITGVKARDIVGYTAIVMVIAIVWVAIGLLLF